MLLARRKYLNQFFTPSKVKKIKCIFSKWVYCLSRLGCCNQYLLSGLKWHIINLQETIPVFMYGLKMPRRVHWKLHICNRSARKDWHTTADSIQTWLDQIEGWMLLLFERAGGGKAKRGIDRVSALPEQAMALEQYVFIPQTLQGNGSDFVTRTYSLFSEVSEWALRESCRAEDAWWVWRATQNSVSIWRVVLCAP